MTDTRKDALVALRDAVKVGHSATEVEVAAMKVWRFRSMNSPKWLIVRSVVLSFNGSLDAAKALHEAVLPGHFWQVSHVFNNIYGAVLDGAKGTLPEVQSDQEPPRVWLLAILDALIAEGEGA